jgi:hypothetical protein
MERHDRPAFGDLLRRHLAAARSCYEESLSIAQDMGDMQTVGFALQWLGALALQRGEQALARQLMEQCRATFQRGADKWTLWVPAWYLGLLDFLDGQPPTSRAWCEESLRLVQETEAWSWIGSELWLPVALGAVRGRHQAALRLFTAGIRAGERWSHFGPEAVNRAAPVPMLEVSRAAIGGGRAPGAGGRGVGHVGRASRRLCPGGTWALTCSLVAGPVLLHTIPAETLPAGSVPRQRCRPSSCRSGAMRVPLCPATVHVRLLQPGLPCDLCLSERGHGRRDAVFGRDLDRGLDDPAVLIDDEVAAHNAPIGFPIHRLFCPHAVSLGDGVLVVDQQREGQVVLGLELLV